VVEGSATKLVKLLSGGPGLEEFAEQSPQMYRMIADLFQQVKDADMISCVCRACSAMMGALEDAEKLDLPLCSELKGHPSMSRYIAEGYEIVSF
ncbi:MAG: DsrE family protein, partial [Spirochaetaceae bacterium]